MYQVGAGAGAGAARKVAALEGPKSGGSGGSGSETLYITVSFLGKRTSNIVGKKNYLTNIRQNGLNFLKNCFSSLSCDLV